MSPFHGGTYEGLVTGKEDPLISAELYDVINPHALKQLDRYEEFYPDRPEDSLYRRTVVRIDEPAVDAWVYIYAGKKYNRANPTASAESKAPQHGLFRREVARP